MSTTAATYLSAQDPTLAAIIATVALPPLVPTNNVFHDLLSCVIEQQIHYRSGKKQFQKLLDTAEIELLTPANFPRFEAKALGNLKLSLPKCETLARILAYFDHHPNNWAALPDAEVRQQLASIKGIGPWTQDMILLYSLGRPNVFPADDYHLKKIMTISYGLHPAARLSAQLRAVAAPWAPEQSTAVRYLLAWKEAQKNRLP